MKADWTRGVWTSQREARDETSGVQRLTFGSDWLPLRAFERIILDHPLAVYGDLLPLLQKSDLNVINVETTLGPYGEPIPKAGPNFQADEASVRSLTEVPFHVALMANNHIMDYGPESLRHTIRIQQKEGLKTVGAGMNGEEAAKPLLLDVGPVRIAIMNCAEGEACRPIDNGPGAYGYERNAAEQQIRELKQLADHVFVVFHGGREYVPLPPQYVVDALRGMAEAGASAVIAHHPHVPQGIEVHNGVPIVYSQGNFVFWQNDGLFYTHSGYLVHLDIDSEHVVRFEISPYTIEQTGLKLMDGVLKTGFLQTLQTISELLAEPRAVRSAWHAFADSIGVEGLVRMIERTISDMDESIEIGAARLHNLFFTPAHRELFLSGLKRASYGKSDDSPAWARKLLEHWRTCEMNEALQLFSALPPNDNYLRKLLQTDKE